MTMFPLTDCCAMLSIDPKTLRHWLKHANVPVAAHPTDARIKCLTLEHVQQLATLHDRLLQSPASAPAGQRCSQKHVQATGLLPASFSQEADLIQKLACLETQVSAMQHHLAQLTLELLQERTWRYEQRLQTLEVLIQAPQRQEARLQALQTIGTQGQQEQVRSTQRDLHPAEQRARSRVLPLIEYGAAGSYVVICPHEGELVLTPDSPAWFDWLATLSSFRFVGQQGRFSASRKGRLSRRWSAYRTIHQHDYQHYLGTTDHLTIDRLEQMAAKLQSYMVAL